MEPDLLYMVQGGREEMAYHAPIFAMRVSFAPWTRFQSFVIFSNNPACFIVIIIYYFLFLAVIVGFIDVLAGSTGRN